MLELMAGGLKVLRERLQKAFKKGSWKQRARQNLQVKAYDDTGRK